LLVSIFGSLLRADRNVVVIVRQDDGKHADYDQNTEEQTESTEAGQVFRGANFRTRTIERNRSGGSGSRAKNQTCSGHAEKRFTNDHLVPFLQCVVGLFAMACPVNPTRSKTNCGNYLRRII